MTEKLPLSTPHRTPVGDAETRFYQAHGLLISSAVELTGYAPCAAPAEENPAVRIESVDAIVLDGPWDRSGACFRLRPGVAHLFLPNLADFIVTEGNHIAVRSSGKGASMVPALVGMAPLGALLMQRGALALHCTTVRGREGDVLLVGPSGSGKSTLAASLHLKGYAICSDDITVVDLDPNIGSRAYSGSTAVRVGPDFGKISAEHAEFANRRQAFLGRYFITPSTPPPTGFKRITDILVLSFHPRAETLIEDLQQKHTAQILWNHVYCGSFAEGLGLKPRLLEVAASLGRRARTRRLWFQRGIINVPAVCDFIRKHVLLE